MSAVATRETLSAATAFEAAGTIAELLTIIEDVAADLTDNDLSRWLVTARVGLDAVGDRLAQLIQLDRVAGASA